ncbi:DUF2207 domain-containing protein [Agromyces mediolanus]|uniref:hypothetical protein n=1 Tax=Agromyces mediolanus TaxID=41986 RepID=UPI003833BF73
MLPLVVSVALVPAIVILAFGIAVRLVSRQPAVSPVVQYLPDRSSTVLRDALLADADRRAVPAALIELAVRRKIRLVADASAGDRAPIGVVLVEGARFTPEEYAVLEALVGPDHVPGRLRRFSADRRALGLRIKALLRFTEDSLAREGLVATRRISWPGTTLTVLAYLGMLSEAVLIVFALVASDWLALGVTLVATAATILTVIITPASWRKYLPPARPKREHLDGLRRYLVVAEGDRLRALQSPRGAQLVPESADATAGPVHDGDAPGDAAPGGAASAGAASAGSPPAEPAGDAIARFHLHERLLPYAVVFGVEREWATKLKLEAAGIANAGEGGTADTLAELVELTADLAQLIELAGGAVELVAALGELSDATGAVIESASDFFDALTP